MQMFLCMCLCVCVCVCVCVCACAHKIKDVDMTVKLGKSTFAGNIYFHKSLIIFTFPSHGKTVR